MTTENNSWQADMVFDGGDLDCGSGLILLIRENMIKTPLGGILEMRSREPTVAGDLPPWCRMAGHEYLGKEEGKKEAASSAKSLIHFIPGMVKAGRFFRARWA